MTVKDILTKVVTVDNIDYITLDEHLKLIEEQDKDHTEKLDKIVKRFIENGYLSPTF